MSAARGGHVPGLRPLRLQPQLAATDCSRRRRHPDAKRGRIPEHARTNDPPPRQKTTAAPSPPGSYGARAFALHRRLPAWAPPGASAANALRPCGEPSVARGVRYVAGPAAPPRCTVDVYVPPGLEPGAAQGAPVVLFAHGGVWAAGARRGFGTGPLVGGAWRGQATVQMRPAAAPAIPPQHGTA